MPSFGQLRQFLPLRANIAETLSLALITEQGENGYQLEFPWIEEEWNPSGPSILPGAERREAERSKADQSGAAGKNTPLPPNPEVVADAKRRRREGLYSSHLTTWRQERDAAVRQALAPKTRGPKPKLDPQQEELQRLRRDNARLTNALRQAFGLQAISFDAVKHLVCVPSSSVPRSWIWRTIRICPRRRWR